MSGGTVLSVSRHWTSRRLIMVQPPQLSVSSGSDCGGNSSAMARRSLCPPMIVARTRTGKVRHDKVKIDIMNPSYPTTCKFVHFKTSIVKFIISIFPITLRSLGPLGRRPTLLIHLRLVKLCNLKLTPTRHEKIPAHSSSHLQDFYHL
jgi:hypothetical protein